MANVARFLDYLLLMRLHRPIGIFLLLWPALWGLWFASGGRPEPLILKVFVLGVVVMRDPWDAEYLAPGIGAVTCYGWRLCQLEACLARLLG